MNTIMKISEALKNFGNHLLDGDKLKQGYADFFVLLAIAGLTSIILTLVERKDRT